MEHYVYILYSRSHDIYYKGSTKDVERRLAKHNAGHSTYTRGKGPWELVCIEGFGSKTEALKRERMLKRQNRKYIEWLLEQQTNLLKRG